MSRMNRRSLLRYGSLGAVAAGLSSHLNPLSARSLLRPPTTTGPKMLFVFLRGGLDGLSLVVPEGDSSYASIRQGLTVTGGQTLNGYAKLHPGMSKVHAAYQAGEAAFFHRMGGPAEYVTRSHFKEMQKFETGVDAHAHELATEGFVPRLLDLHQPIGGTYELRGVSHSRYMQRLCQSSHPDRVLVHLRALEGYGIVPPTTAQYGPDYQLIANELDGAFDQYPASNVLDGLVHETGEVMIASEPLLEAVRDNLVHDEVLFPNQYSDVDDNDLDPVLNDPGFFEFSRSMEESLAILLETSASVACVEYGGFDNHQNQFPHLDNLLRRLDYAVGSFHEATTAADADSLIVVCTEFGRTVAPNGSFGTDHGVGAAYFVVGSRVKEGVYNCQDPGSIQSQFGAGWQALSESLDGSVDPAYADATVPATHPQAFLAQVARNFFHLNGNEISHVIPNYRNNQQTGGPLYEELDFIEP